MENKTKKKNKQTKRSMKSSEVKKSDRTTIQVDWKQRKKIGQERTRKSYEKEI